MEEKQIAWLLRTVISTHVFKRTYEERREPAREGRGIAAFVSWFHLVLDWLRSRACQLRDASARVSRSGSKQVEEGSLLMLRRASGNQSEAGRVGVEYAGLDPIRLRADCLLFSHANSLSTGQRSCADMRI
jgi:hypothetical protein